MSHLKKSKNQKSQKQDSNNNNNNKIIPLQQIINLTSIQILFKSFHTKNNNNNNRIILWNYIRNKLLNKKIQKGISFNTIILGIEQQFQIIDFQYEGKNKQQKQQEIKKQQEQIKIEQQQSSIDKKSRQQIKIQIPKKQIIYAVKQNTKIIIIDKDQYTKRLKKDQNNLKVVDQQSEKEQLKIPFFGMDQQYQKFKAPIQKGLFHKKELQSIGLGSIKGILLSGFSGTGKSTFLKVLQSQLKSNKNKNKYVHFKIIETFKLLHKYIGGAQQLIKNIFDQIKQNLPACLIIQDLHLIFGKGMKQDTQTTLAAILSQIDNIKKQQALIVIGTYNSQRDIHDDLKRSGRFQKQFNLEIPRHHQRAAILKGYLNKINLEKSLDEQDIKSINLRMNGFNITQLQQILRDAYLEDGQKLSLKTIENVLKNFKPREIKELIVQVPQVYWRQIGGYEEVKDNIIKDIQWPLKKPEKFKKMGMQAMKGILLYGPPGCSKTMMAKAIATQSKLNFIGIKGPQLFSKYVGQSQRAIRNIFKRARACSPCVIFFDQIDALGSQRSANTDVADRVLTQLLNQMDGIQGLKEVIIVAATNRPYSLDPALLRPGRFDRLIYIGPPDQKARQQIFKIYTQKMPIDDKQSILKQMVSDTQNYTGAQIQLLCKQAAYDSLSKEIESQDPKITIDNFKNARKKVKNRQTKQSLLKYQQFTQNVSCL